MKAEFDKEIEALLREGARHRRRASGEGRARADDDARAAGTTAHLDADEQSAYAEHALPVAARAHYTAHLADCDACRRGVTQLALAAGMPAQVETRETATGQAAGSNAGWRERLGALFAPRAWRYAVPALALLLVGAVALIVLKSNLREGTSSIARQNTSETKSGEAAQPDTHHAPQNDNAATTNAPGEAAGLTKTADPNAPAQNPYAPLSKEEIAANSVRPEAAQPPAGTAVQTAVAPPAPAPASGGGTGAFSRAISESPTPAPTPAPVVSDAVTIASERGTKVKSGEPLAELQKLEQRRGDFENRQYENRQREQMSGPRRNEQAQNRRAPDADYARNRDDKKDGNLAASAATTTTPPAAAPPAAAAAARAAKRARPPREADRGTDETRPAEDAEGEARAPAKTVAETRAVAGRTFRRQGGAWVDTGYRAGQSSTVVRRNSEQFRALVADEPQLRRVADALGGEVTVVWKGRAYRIR
jgi:hypothetical protein